jgi:hypothetical protein
MKATVVAFIGIICITFSVKRIVPAMKANPFIVKVLLLDSPRKFQNQ